MTKVTLPYEDGIEVQIVAPKVLKVIDVNGRILDVGIDEIEIIQNSTEMKEKQNA